jgi:hypothetical protein
MEPHWLSILAWVALGLGLASALAIVADQLRPGGRQHMWVMNLVHPITALYLGPVWLRAYVRRGRASSHGAMHAEAERLADAGADPDELRRRGSSTEPPDLEPWHVADAVSHCGAGCTLGDIGGEWLLFALGSPALGVAGTFGWEVIVDFALAWTLGVAFQYLTLGEGGILRAIKVDTLSILSFQLGLFGWMAIAHFVLFRPPLAIDTSSHWLMMQIGMILGFATAWPVNRWLVRRGTKEKMDVRTHLAPLVERLRDADADVTAERATRSAAPSA